MPRQSKAARDVVPFLSVVPVKPLPCPANVKGTARQTWNEIVGSMPPEFFKPSAQAILVCYVNHVAIERAIQRAAARCKPGTDKALSLMRGARAEAKTIIALARALRLTPRSQLNARAARDRIAEVPPADEPWTFKG
jgi:hypothetical protein